MKIKNSSGSSVEPWRSIAFTLYQYCPIKTLYFHALNKSVKTLSALPVNTFCLSLKIRPLCEALSKALELVR